MVGVQNFFQKSFLVVLSLLASLFITEAFAAVSEWQILTNDSKLTFTGTQNNSPASGEFKKFNGSVFFDPENLADSHVKITVDMNSVHTSYADFTVTLLTDDWFDVKIFPEAIFEAKQFKVTGDNAYDAIGTLTIRDKTQPVTIAFKAKPISDKEVMVTGEAVIKRNMFGVGQGDWQSTDEVKDEVTVNFHLKAKRQ